MPSIALQEELVEIFKSENHLKSIIDREIKIVEEYKTALIAEAVTGRIDVREWISNKQEDRNISTAEPTETYK